MLYKKNYKDVIKRLTEFYERKGLNKIYAVMNVENSRLTEYKNNTSDGETTYPDLNDRIKLWDEICRENQTINDDSLRIAYLSELDEGLYGGLVGGKLRFINDSTTAWISSMTEPFIEELEEALNLELPNDDQIWMKRYIEQLKLYKEKSNNLFGVSHFILIDGINFLFELRGATNAFYDVLENEEVAKKVMEFAKKLNVQVQNLYFDIIGLFEGGTVSNMLQWCPGKIVSESVDPFHLTDLDFFDQYGKDYIEDVVSNFDGFCVHIHANGYYLVEKVSQLKGIKGMYLLDDPYNPRAFDQIDELDKARGTTPIVVTLTYDEFKTGLDNHILKGNIMYNVLDVPSVDEANDLMKKVYKYEA